MSDQSLKPLARRLLQVDFEELADTIRDNERRKTLPDEIRELFASAAEDMRQQFADVEPEQIGHVLLMASIVSGLAIEQDAGWTARSVVNLLASIGERLCHAARPVEPASDGTSVRSWLAQNLGRRTDHDQDDDAKDGADG